MSRFEPVFLPEDRALNDKASQTLLRHYERCPRAGYLYQRYKQEAAPTAEMVRGTAVHLVHERAVQLMLENGEVTIPEPLVKVLADEVLAELPVPFSEHDAVREMAWRLGAEVTVDPETVVAAETLFALDVGGFEVRCRIDFAEVLDNGARVHVEDLKSSKAAVTQEEIARKRPDGSLSAKAFQLVLYAISLAYGVPVREEACPECLDNEYATSDRPPCPVCGGKGRVEVKEPFPVASRAQHFDLEFVYPAIEGTDGKMLRRAVTLTRGELEQYRVSLAGLVGRLQESERSGDWPAVVSDAACGECPASICCPVPKELKDHRGTVNTVAEAAEAFEVREREAKTQRARAAELRKFVEVRGPVRFGGGMVAEVVPTTTTEIKDKDGFLAAVDEAARFGTPLDRSRFVKEKHGMRLQVRALSVDELVDSEGSNG